MDEKLEIPIRYSADKKYLQPDKVLVCKETGREQFFLGDDELEYGGILYFMVGINMFVFSQEEEEYINKNFKQTKEVIKKDFQADNVIGEVDKCVFMSKEYPTKIPFELRFNPENSYIFYETLKKLNYTDNSLVRAVTFLRRKKMKKKKLTKTEAAIYQFIKTYFKQHGYTPAQKHIAEYMDSTQPTVSYHLLNLEKKLWIKRLHKKIKPIIIL